MLHRFVLTWFMVTALAASAPPAHASGPLHGPQTNELEKDADALPSAPPSNVRLVRDEPYGADEKQRMDVYLPQQSKNAPVIFMVHGGAWRMGDKAHSKVVHNKVARWVARGFVFVSVNYRLLPQAGPLEQAQDVARALAAAQSKAASWGADPTKFILMGHSAGAHLVALLNAAPEAACALGAKPWLGTVSLDSAAYDVVRIMQSTHPRLYDRAFGKDASQWRVASPAHVLKPTAKPLLAVCSKPRSDNSCGQATEFVRKLTDLGVPARVLEQDLSHAQINGDLGTPGSYTDAVEAFMGELDASVRQTLHAR